MISAKVLAPDDWPVWRELRLRALADSPWAFGRTLAEVLARDTEEHWRAGVSAPMVSFVVETADGPVGMARLMFPERASSLPELISVWVAPEARRTGASRALIAACVDHLAAHHPMTRLRLAVVETNMPARRLYESCGFGVIGRNPDDDTELLMERRAAPMGQQSVELPTELVARYRAVDRERVGTPTLDTPAHLDRLTELIGREGMRTPIDLAFNEQFATIDGNHRIAVARRLGLATVPVHLTRRPEHPRPGHGRDMDPADLRVLEAALASSPVFDPDRAGRGTGIVARASDGARLRIGRLAAMSSTSRDALVLRPFEGLPNEQDLVAMRQLIPAATMAAKTTAEHGAVDVEIATILPMAWPAVRRTDGSITVGIQAAYPGGDLSRGIGQAIKQALALEPGNPITSVTLDDDAPRLQEILDLTGDFTITVHDTFEFWLDPSAERTPEIESSIQEANQSIMPTRAVAGLEHAYWVDAGPKEHLRWVLDADEEKVIDAVTRLHARRESGVGEGTKYVGSFRAEGLAIPVWDLPKGFGAEGVEAEAEAFRTRFEEALHTEEPLTALERRARGGIVARQVTLR